MPNINLLPWREDLREERKRQFLVVLCGVVLLGLLIGYAAELRLAGQIQSQQLRNQILTTGIATLDAQVAEIRELRTKKSDMLERMDVIKDLQTNRPEIVRLFDEFARAMPDGAFVESIVVSGQTMTIEGKAESNIRVSSLMRQLNASEKFANPNLTRVNADGRLGEQGSSFSMSVQVQSLAVE